MKAFTSVLSTDQLIQLGREILSGDALRNLNALATSHELYFSDPYHSRGGTPNWNRQEIIQLIASKNNGTAPDDLVRNRDAARLAPPKPTHAPPTSKPVETPKPQRIAAVYVPCAACGKPNIVPEDKADSRIWCNEVCMATSNRAANTMLSEGDKFMEMMGSRLYNCEYNTNVLLNYLLAQKKTITCDNLLDSYLAVKGQLLSSLSARDIDAMSSEQLAARLKIDPELGGVNQADVRKYQSKTGGVN